MLLSVSHLDVNSDSHDVKTRVCVSPNHPESESCPGLAGPLRSLRSLRQLFPTHINHLKGCYLPIGHAKDTGSNFSQSKDGEIDDGRRGRKGAQLKRMEIAGGSDDALR